MARTIGVEVPISLIEALAGGAPIIEVAHLREDAGCLAKSLHGRLLLLLSQKDKTHLVESDAEGVDIAHAAERGNSFLIDGDGLVVTLHSAQCRPLHGEPDGHLSLIAKQRVDYVCLLRILKRTLVIAELIVDFRRHAIDDGLSRSVVCAGGIAQRLQDVLFSLSRVVGSQVDARQGIEGGGSLVRIAQLLVDADATRGILCGCREVGQPHTDNGQQIEAVALGGIVMTVEGQCAERILAGEPILLGIVEPLSSPIPHLLAQRVCGCVGGKLYSFVGELLLIKVVEEAVGGLHAALLIEVGNEFSRVLCP